MIFETLSRRELLQRGATAGGVAIAGPTLLAACGGDDDEAATKNGGRFRVGLGGGSSKDTIDAHQLLSGIDGARLANLYDKLFDYSAEFKVEPVLAESAEPNRTADQWTVRIREGVEFHNGKTMTADDIIFSVRRMLDPKVASPAASRLPPVNPKTGLVKVDDRTVRFELDSPFALFQESFTEDMVMMVPEGYDPAKPVGSGPFVYKSFDPGRQSVFTRNRNYWRGPPRLDEVVILDYGDDSARVNALLSGQLDAIGDVPFAQIPVVEGNDNLQMLIAESGFWRPITMRVDVPPFDDVRVRQALRLIADRPQMIEQALAGQGRLGNDVWGIDDPCYHSDLPQREQDLDQAKSLLKQAGQENLSLELVTSQIRNGVVEMSEVFAEQARAAGVNIKVNKVEPGVFFGDQYIKWPFAVDYWPPNGFFDQTRASSRPDSIWNETHFDDKEFNDLYDQAVRELDEDKRCEIAYQMQEIQYERGGYIIWGFGNLVDAYSTKFTGLKPSRASNLGSYSFRTVSLA
jgi:peptide/nickel transport system substrate-binding protein